MTRSSHDGAPATKIPSKGSMIDPSHGYPHGHLGHLTADQETAFSAFKAHLEAEKLYQPGPPPSHDDPTLLRFLRARRWVVADATQQFRDTEAWRAASQIDRLYDTIDVAAYEQSRRLYPQWTGRRDRRGIPLYLFEIRHLDSKTIAAYEKSAAADDFAATGAGAGSGAGGKKKTGTATTEEAKMTRLFALYENLTRFAQPLCSQMTDREYARTTPITLSTNIVDVSGVSLRQFWNLKGHMQAASVLATAHYPETLDRIFVVGAPVFFSTVWGWIKRWFDPVTVSKIFILSHSEVLPTLKDFIDLENIPKQYGGKLEFNWCDMPNLDPHIKALASWENGHDTFPPGPLYWVPTEDGKRLSCVARGSVDKKERNEVVCTIPKAFADEQQQEAAAAALVVENGKTVEPAGVNGTTTDESVDAPESPPAVEASNKTAAEVPAIEDLSLEEAEKKNAEVAAAVVASEKLVETGAVPNGKPVAA